MIIAGLQKLTLLDYPGKVACIIFTPWCNFRCVYCHNYELVFNKRPHIPEEEILNFLKDRMGLLDGVVITGGEPTLQKDLPKFISKIKRMGYLVKLDTNGSNPSMIKELLSKGLLDFIAMDVKAPFSKYKEVVGVDVDTDLLKESIKIIMSSKVDYVFRTTAWPKLTLEDYEEIGKQIKGAKLYHLQQFSNKYTLDPTASKVQPLKRQDLERIAQVMKKYVSKVEILNI